LIATLFHFRKTHPPPPEIPISPKNRDPKPGRNHPLNRQALTRRVPFFNEQLGEMIEWSFLFRFSGEENLDIDEPYCIRVFFHSSLTRHSIAQDHNDS
ncbi:MAG: hypothetical protein ABJZ55_08150, partial [Fuerstiella sp.]